MSAERPAKVAIVGGGCAAITTAFELSRPERRARYDITIYQEGWRLGGKGASGRGPSGRIEEHGLHIWLGFYENSFRLLRECYAELAIDPGNFDVADWRTAFFPDNDIGVSERSGPDAWHSWSTCFPTQPGLPGDPVSNAELFSVSRYLGRAVELLLTLLRSTDSRSAPARREGSAADPTGPTFAAAAIGNDPQRMLTAIRDLIGGAFAATGAVLAEALAVLQAAIAMLPSPLANPVTDLAEWIAHHLRRWLENSLITMPYFQHLWEVMDVVVASVVGALRYGLLSDPRGFDTVDNYDWREWLRLNGASERAIQSGFVRGVYDLTFAYEDGDFRRPSLSAAAALRGPLRMFFTYRGALYWKMRAGMGDVVFAPFYEVLRRRGVKFEFFHRLTNLRLSSDADLGPGERPYVTALEFDVQAKTKEKGAFRPLVVVNDRPCWPAGPDFSQLLDGALMEAEGRDFESHWDRRKVATKTLVVAQDFDFVVLGVGLGAVPHVCREVVARDGRWRQMVESVKTISTQAFQIWLKQDLESLGWKGPGLSGSGFAGPFDNWCDMAHVIPEEGWAQRPRTVLYFCGALADTTAIAEQNDPAYPDRRRQDVRRHAIAYLQETARHLWPLAYDERGDFRWDLLADPSPDVVQSAVKTQGDSCFETQYWRANLNPSDRYVLAVPGSAKYRVSPLDMTYDNLTVAGDWTDCGLNQGCVEAAVMSGRLAAHALDGAPLLEDIVGYDHP